MSGGASPLFSVVVPTHNRLPLLKQALESVWRQTFRDFELIVVDDGSTDGTSDWLAGQTARLRFLRQRNAGPGAARNLGAAAVSGEYLAFLDSDDLWFPWTLSSYAEVLQASPRPAIIGGGLLSFSVESELASARARPVSARRYTDFLSAGAAGAFVGSNMLVVDREAFLASGGFLTDRLNAEDHDLMLRLGIRPGFVQIVEPKTIAWRQHSTSETSDIVRTVQGVARLIGREEDGAYPGGRDRRGDRRRFITQHVRAASLAGLRAGFLREALPLYRRALVWHLRQLRLKFILGFPLVGVRTMAKGRKRAIGSR